MLSIFCLEVVSFTVSCFYCNWVQCVIYKVTLLSSKVGRLPCNITNVIIIKHHNSVLASTLLREKVIYTFDIFCLEKQNPSKIPNFSTARISHTICSVVIH
jgi:hypothetical protein